MGAVAAGAAVDGDAAHAVGDAGRALHDADHSGGVLAVGADGATDGATADGQRASIVRLADEASGIEVMGVVGALGAVDVYHGVAVSHIYIAALQGDESGGVAIVGGGDVAHHVQVLDDGVVGVAAALHVAEGGAVVVGGGVVEGQRMAVAVEGAGEVVVHVARHAADADVRAKFHGLAAEAVPRVVVVEHLAEVEPVIGIINKVDVGAAGRQSNSGVIEVVVTDAVLIDGGTHEVEALCLVAYCSRGGGAADGLGAVGGDIVAVGQCGRCGVVNMADVGRGGTVVVVHGHGMERGGARCGAAVRAGEEAVTEIDGIAVAPALQTAHIVAAVGDVTAIDSVAHVEGAVEGVAHDTATVVVITAGGGDGDIGGHLAVGDGVHGGGIGTTGEAHQSGGVYGADDAARHNEILDGSAFDFAEGCSALRRGLGDVDGECLSIAVEGAHELVARAARRLRDADVGTEFHGLAAEVVPRVVVQQGIAEIVPTFGTTDEVGAVL